MSILASTLAVAAAVAATGPAPAAAAQLEPFPRCSSLIEYGNANSHRFARFPARMHVMELSADSTPTARAEAAPATGGASGAADTSTTNVQEAGVDEPDIVKTDGDRILAIANGRLHAIDVSGAVPVLAGSVRLPQQEYGPPAHALLIAGDRALVSSLTWDAGGEKTTFAEVDVSDSKALRVLRTLEVDGALVTSRLTGTTVRAVLRSAPRALELPVYRANVGGKGGYRLRKARRANQWLPAAELRDRTNGRVRRRAALRCTDVNHAPAFSGLQTVTVLTIDLSLGLDPVDTDSVLTDADTVYASPTSLYVASRRWSRTGSATLTQIHRFDTSAARSTVYEGSGAVPGNLLNQFSLSEHRGVLRAASTKGDESFVTTLGPNLTQLGQVGGLGRDERIYAVRFIGDLGYVVTFRETDPLYTIDLSDPLAPTVRGELKIRGYSAYLHPAGDGLLIGVGQDATDRGETLGTQISLFDVSDPASPTRLAHRTVAPGSSSEAEYDHHAFLWWPETGLAVLPVTVWDEDYHEQEFAGALGLRVDRAGGIREAGRVEHPRSDGWPAGVSRSLVARGRLYTLSHAGLMQSTLDTLQRTAWLPLE